MSDIVERLERFAKEGAGVAVLIDAAEEIKRLTKALEKIRSYNVDIAAGRINYRPHDHIQVIDEAFDHVESPKP